MSPYSSLHPWTFTELLNALHLILQRSTFFSVYFAIGLWLYSQILLRHSPDESFPILPLFGDSHSQGILVPSWIISPYLTECAFPSRRGSPRWRRTCCIAFQEVSSSFTDRSCVAVPFFHSRENQERPILKNLLGCPDRSFSTTDFPGFWYQYRVISGLVDDTTESIFVVKFIIGLDFVVTRSSPDPCWARFAIAAVQAVELKWLMLNKLKKWFHSSRVKFPLVNVILWILLQNLSFPVVTLVL